MKRSNKILLGCLALFLLFSCLTAVVGIGGYLGYKSYNLIKQPANAVNAHFDAAKKGQYKKAYDYFAESLKRDMSYDNFLLHVKHNPDIYESAERDLNEVSISNGIATVKGSITVKGSKRNVSFKLVYENGGWKITNFDFGSTLFDKKDYI